MNSNFIKLSLLLSKYFEATFLIFYFMTSKIYKLILSKKKLQANSIKKKKQAQIYLVILTSKKQL